MNRRLSREVGQDKEQGGVMLKKMVFGIQGSWARTVGLVFLECSTSVKCYTILKPQFSSIVKWAYHLLYGVLHMYMYMHA